MAVKPRDFKSLVSTNSTTRAGRYFKEALHQSIRYLSRFVYGQDVLYAARGQEARSRDGQDVLYAARGHAYRT